MVQQRQIRQVRELLSGSVTVGATVVVQGWVRTRRDAKSGISFLNLTDGSCHSPLQVVVPNRLSNYQTEVLRLTSGCSVKVMGTLVASIGKGQAFEVAAEEVTVLGWVEDPETYPIQPKDHTPEFLRAHAHLRARTLQGGAVARIRHTLAAATHRFFHQQGFFWVNTPIVSTSDCEGAGQMFRVSTLDLANIPRTPEGKVDFTQDFFGKETFLTVSGQLNAEGYALALSRVYTFGPTFRAEPSNTARHLAEFWMVEPEVAFNDLDANAALAESYFRRVLKDAVEERAEDLQFLGQLDRLAPLADQAFARVTYTRAIELLQGSGKSFVHPVSWGMDLQTEHERWLAEEYVQGPIVVTDYPEKIKAFYMRRNDDGKTVAAMDVLAPGIGEIIGGSQREERLDLLDEKIRETGLDPVHYGWYRDLRRYGTVPHAGFGLGFERLVSYVCGLSNIREAIPYPRAAGQAEF